jgi:lactoylglutathione lyase
MPSYNIIHVILPLSKIKIINKMKIDHIAIWVNNLEKTKEFYEKYFGAVSNTKYHNPAKNFQSYFLSFQDGCRMEIMHKPDITESSNLSEKPKTGIIHLAMSVGAKENVDALTNLLRTDGYKIIGEPRITGDGCYESVVLDPENNIVEIVWQ